MCSARGWRRRSWRRRSWRSIKDDARCLGIERSCIDEQEVSCRWKGRGRSGEAVAAPAGVKAKARRTAARWVLSVLFWWALPQAPTAAPSVSTTLKLAAFLAVLFLLSLHRPLLASPVRVITVLKPFLIAFAAPRAALLPSPSFFSPLTPSTPYSQHSLHRLPSPGRGERSEGLGFCLLFGKLQYLFVVHLFFSLRLAQLLEAVA